ncbi:hypothetical protein HYT25_03045 [Candidatus Pacearchaeota archaeon]|nr:hypothetical protein [Candidatus Pacearchaeota archaeon]
MKNKKWKIEFSEEINKKINNLPDKVYEEFEKIIQGLKTGELDPREIL